VDLSASSAVTISDADGDTLIIYANGTFEAFASACELEIVGPALPASSSSKAKRDACHLEKQQSSSAFCNDVQAFCNSAISVFLESAAGSALCVAVGANVGAEIGGIGFLGNVFGLEVGIPTTLLGVALSETIGNFLATKLRSTLCVGITATVLLTESLSTRRVKLMTQLCIASPILGYSSRQISV
jgi:hypothetical protein